MPDSFKNAIDRASNRVAYEGTSGDLLLDACVSILASEYRPRGRLIKAYVAPCRPWDKRAGSNHAAR